MTKPDENDGNWRDMDASRPAYNRKLMRQGLMAERQLNDGREKYGKFFQGDPLEHIRMEVGDISNYISTIELERDHHLELLRQSLMLISPPFNMIIDTKLVSAIKEVLGIDDE